MKIKVIPKPSSSLLIFFLTAKPIDHNVFAIITPVFVNKGKVYKPEDRLNNPQDLWAKGKE